MCIFEQPLAHVHGERLWLFATREKYAIDFSGVLCNDGGPGTVELPTNGLGNRCSIHLSYRAARRNRLVLLQFTATDGWEASAFVAQSLPDCGIASSSFAIAACVSADTVLM